jgi:soluble lytic murein transglycosylase-like protein
MREHSANCYVRIILRKVDIMKRNNKIFLGSLVCLFVAVILLSVNQVQANKKIEAYENANLTLKDANVTLIAKVDSQEETINVLSIELEKAVDTIKLQEPMVSEYKKVSKFIDFDALESTQLEKAKEISDATPLDYESAVVLVKYADLYDVPYSLVLSIIDIESGFAKDLVGTSQDRGYMQIIPGTEKWLANTYGAELGLTYNPDRIFEPEYNLALGIKYLDDLMGDYGSNYDRILSEYNRGAGNLKKYYAANQTYSTSYSRKILENETIYVSLND